MNLKIYFAFFLFFNCLFAISQNKIEDVSIEDLQATENPSFPDAKAAILYSDQQTYIVSNAHEVLLVTEVKKRIKFYGDDFDHATQHLYVHQSSAGREEISKIEGTTYNLSNGKIEETKLKNNGIFEKEFKKNIEEISFTLPAVKKGSIIEFEYKKTSPFYWDLDEFVFQYDIPLMKATTQVNTPANFLFTQTHKGFETVRETHEKKMDYRINQEVNIYTYQSENIPAMKEEKYVDNIRNYRSGIIFELVYISFSDGTNKQFSVTWDDVAKTVSNTSDYKEGLRSGIFKDDIDQLIENENDTLNKLNSIFDFVKTTIKWNGLYGKYFDNGIRKAYKEKKGNVADVNLSLVSMLRYAGIQAYPVIISTRDNLKPISPTLDKLNYIIVLAEIDGQNYFMDATESYSQPNLLPLRDYNWRGMLLDGEKWHFVDVTEPSQSDLIQMLNVTLNPDFSASGKVMTKLSNHYAFYHRKKITSSSKEDFIRKKESTLKNISISNYESNYDDESGSATESFEYEFKNAIEDAGDKLFLNPLFFFAAEESPFKTETRSYPINFGYPFKDKTIVNIKIPDGYEVAFIPESIRMELGENLGEFEYLISNKGNFISVSMGLEINKASILPTKYDYLKKFYSQMIDKQRENIVLKKI